MQVHPSRLQQVPDHDRPPPRYPRDDEGRNRGDRRPSPSYDHYSDRNGQEHRVMYPPRDGRRLTPERELGAGYGGGGGGGYPPPRGGPDHGYGYGGGYGQQQQGSRPPQQRQGAGGRDEFFEASVLFPSLTSKPLLLTRTLSPSSRRKERDNSTITIWPPSPRTPEPQVPKLSRISRTPQMRT